MEMSRCVEHFVARFNNMVHLIQAITLNINRPVLIVIRVQNSRWCTLFRVRVNRIVDVSHHFFICFKSSYLLRVNAFVHVGVGVATLFDAILTLLECKKAIIGEILLFNIYLLVLV